MRCHIIRSFVFSEDGFTTQPARNGQVVDIPAHLVPALEAEGYLTRVHETKDAGPAPENKMVKNPAPENKAPAARKGVRR